ncbi:hypothetical protein ANAEL_02779 [Anaerolineales bacterium]|nr:hypothetical protein ANAEL_02779 [Anaerolineales bacterium]
MIYGVTVNHNTSRFVELMLRTLFLTNDLSGLAFHMVVLDNASNDEYVEQLTAYLANQSIPFIQTGLDNRVAVEKHGLALANFVKERKDCTHYLFLDSDMWFVENDTIPTMWRELVESPSSVFANQARIHGYYADRAIEGRDGVPGANSLDGVEWETVCGNPVVKNTRYTTRIAYRCSPVCSLIANTPVFRTVTETIGLNPAISFGAWAAKHYDTFGLMTHVMATHGFRFIVSSKTVNHFTETVYRPELRAPKDKDCSKMLEELQAGRGMELENFRLSDWVKQNRQSSGTT